MVKTKKPIKRLGTKISNVKPGWVFYIVLAVLVVFIGLRMYTHNRDLDRQAKQQKADYAVVDKQMQAVMAGIIKTAGEPAEMHKTYGCGKTAAKFDEGHMTCNIAYSFYYEASSIPNAANSTRNMISEIQTLTKNTLEDSMPSVTDSSSFSHYSSDFREISCDYNFQAESTQDWFNQTKSSNGFHTNASSPYAALYVYQCGGRVAKALFP
jgi:hypothetical protein